jgi:hypothetical protein
LSLIVAAVATRVGEVNSACALTRVAVASRAVNDRCVAVGR